MVENTQNSRCFALCPSSGILKLRNTTFRKLDLFPSSGVGERRLLHWVRQEGLVIGISKLPPTENLPRLSTEWYVQGVHAVGARTFGTVQKRDAWPATDRPRGPFTAHWLVF
jgi:hypothetical protein